MRSDNSSRSATLLKAAEAVMARCGARRAGSAVAWGGGGSHTCVKDAVCVRCDEKESMCAVHC